MKIDKRTCARELSLVENEGLGYKALLKELYPKSLGAYLVGITGPPGSGKSTLTDKLVKLLSERGETVSVIAVDPTSPFTRGALLGDRVRMQGISVDPNVFIRSMGSRGELGGLSKAVAGAAVVLGAHGYAYIFIETVGVGQSEVEIAGLADTTVMVLAPGLGDDIQAHKAGVMEIGDIFAVNKADKDGALKTFRETAASLDFKTDSAFKPPVCLTVAETGEGVPALLEHIISHKTFLTESGELAAKRQRNKAALVRRIVRESLMAKIDGNIAAAGDTSGTDPYTLAEMLLGNNG